MSLSSLQDTGLARGVVVEVVCESAHCCVLLCAARPQALAGAPYLAATRLLILVRSMHHRLSSPAPIALHSTILAGSPFSSRCPYQISRCQ
jgi:hypothetical protein